MESFKKPFGLLRIIFLKNVKNKQKYALRL